ncbi:hypothetical protein ATCC90586_003494 [Pythium insidiosum]|nr:hypothetical protein ATCC90586_003494 [Pythium insidiosum]
MDDATAPLEQLRDVVVNGDVFHALELCRRLLQTPQSHETARLLLDRLRANHETDSSDHVAAVLRLLAAHMAPTKELTEELLSLLFFCDHRVQLIHHLSKLVYQSRECVETVVATYVDLLATDGELLVPILGSLADLPLQPADKARVVEATECLLDAASEQDLPAVVQSLLSMVAPTCANRVAAKIRDQCNRVHSGTLSLLFEVVLRHATAGSCALQAFLRIARGAVPLTVFDVTLLSLLMGKPVENPTAVRVVAALVKRGGAISVSVLRETVERLTSIGWREALAALVRLASATLASCFSGAQTRVAPSVSTAVGGAVDTLALLIAHRTVAQEESLSLLLSLVSQPHRLLQLGSSASPSPRVVGLCWHVAFAVADRLAALTTTHPQTIAPFAHLFLDQLHTIASASAADRSAAYPPALLDSLCRTMVRILRHERGMLPLVMITIQKQLIATPGSGLLGHGQQQQQQHVKQLVAVFLAGHVLLERAGDPRDQQSALQAMLKLLSAPTSDATALHVLRVVSGRLHSALSSADRRRVAALLEELQQRKGVALVASAAAQASGRSELIVGLSGQKDASLVLDALASVKGLRMGQAKGDRLLADGDTKLALLGELFAGRVRFVTSEDNRVLDCGFLLPGVEGNAVLSLWAAVAALHVAVRSVNLLVERPPAKTASTTELVRYRRHVLQRVETCWLLSESLSQRVSQCQASLDACKTDGQPQDDAVDSAVTAIRSAVAADRPAWTLSGLSTDAVVAVLEALWKRSAGSQDVLPAPLEAALVGVFSRRLAQWTGRAGEDPTMDHTHESVHSLERLVASPSGRRAIKYVISRLLEAAVTLGAKAVALELSHAAELLVAGARQSADLLLETLAKGALRSLPSAETLTLASRALCCEVLFQTLQHAAVSTEDPDVACHLVIVLQRLVLRTRRQDDASELCLALVHYPYATSAELSPELLARVLEPLPLSVVLPASARVSALARFRVSSAKAAHVSMLLVAAWATTASSRRGLAHLVYVADAMDALVQAAAASVSLAPPEDDDNPSRWLVGDGEHRVLKTLSNESLAWFLETVGTSAMAALQRATPSRATEDPFQDAAAALGALAKCFDVLTAAESTGFSLPLKSSVVFLRAGQFIHRSVHQLVQRCLAWRIEQRPSSSQDAADVGALEHLASLLAAVRCLATSMRSMAESFQDRIVLKVQASRRGLADSAEPKAKHRRRWDNELLGKTYGDALQRRRAISKREAQLLPYFVHATDALDALVDDQSHIHGIEIERDSVPTADDLTQHLRLSGEDLERVLGLVEGASVSASTLQTTPVASVWQPLQDDSGVSEDDGELSDEDVEEGEDADEEADEEEEEEEEEEAEAEPPAPTVTVLVAKPKRQRR